MNLNNILRQAQTDGVVTLPPAASTELTTGESQQLRTWFESAHRRNEIAIVAELTDERLIALALWCHIDAQTITYMPPDIRATELNFASEKFQVELRALPSLIVSTGALFKGAKQ